MPPLQLLIESDSGPGSEFRLDGARVQLGRASTNELSFPEDARLSRNHLAFEPRGELWIVRDLGSKNGTFVNGKPLHTDQPIRPGDSISAGELRIQVSEVVAPPVHHVEFVRDESGEFDDPLARTVITDINQYLKRDKPTGTPDVVQRHMEALVRAGRELAGHRPLDELFSLILDLSLSAVTARRGVLMLMEDGQLVPKAAKGDHFRISKAVCEEVLQKRQSLLVRDTQFEKAFLASHSIAAESVKSLVAVPLQTNNEVMGLIYLDMPHIIAPFTEEDLALLTVMANVAAIRLEQARLILVEQAERLMQRDLDQAAEIQQGLLPTELPQVAGVTVAGFNQACLTVGGDYYDFFAYPDGRLATVLGDAAGKGMAAALMMSGVHARSHLLLEEPAYPAEYLTRLNRATVGNCPQNRFITIAAALFDPQTGELHYSSAGHNPAIVVRASGTTELLTESGLVLGILKIASYQNSVVQLGEGDMLVLYSDGITEARKANSEEEFGEDRLRRVLAANAHLNPQELIDIVIRAQTYFLDGAPNLDDATLVIIRRGAATDSTPKRTQATGAFLREDTPLSTWREEATGQIPQV